MPSVQTKWSKIQTWKHRNSQRQHVFVRIGMFRVETLLNKHQMHFFYLNIAKKYYTVNLLPRFNCTTTFSHHYNPTYKQGNKVIKVCVTHLVKWTYILYNTVRQQLIKTLGFIVCFQQGWWLFPSKVHPGISDSSLKKPPRFQPVFPNKPNRYQSCRGGAAKQWNPCRFEELLVGWIQCMTWNECALNQLNQLVMLGVRVSKLIPWVALGRGSGAEFRLYCIPTQQWLLFLFVFQSRLIKQHHCKRSMERNKIYALFRYPACLI